MIRVQMVSNDIPAYQADFTSEDDALSAAARLAIGSKAEKVDAGTEVARYEFKAGYIRVFAFCSEAPAIVHSSVIDAMHLALNARWEAAGKPFGAGHMCIRDLVRLIDNLPDQQPVASVLSEAIEVLEAFAELDGAKALEPHEAACIEIARGVIAAQNMSARSALPAQLVMMDKARAKRDPKSGFYLRVAVANGADTVELKGAVTARDALCMAKAKGYSPTHWMEVGGTHPTKFS